jgi:hypothetical protein
MLLSVSIRRNRYIGLFLLVATVGAVGSLGAQEERIEKALALRDQALDTIREVSADSRYYQLWLHELRRTSSWLSGSPDPQDPVIKALILYQSSLPGAFARLEETSPSGDWSKLTDYTFDSLRRIAVIDSTLNTFYGDVQVKRTFVFATDGSVIESDMSVVDLETGEPVEPGTRSFQDNPPEVFFSVQEIKGMMSRRQ